ncbi:hypothetical protein OAP25_03335 [Flavobacteriaceae bacterium]|nr:hypothetical protein [Flavobacteriaceae bacterium]
MKKLKNFGIALGIFGCLFKLMSWQGAPLLLTIGLSSLGVYYLIRIFEKDPQ